MTILVNKVTFHSMFDYIAYAQKQGSRPKLLIFLSFFMLTEIKKLLD